MYRILHLSDPHFGAANRQQADAIVETAGKLNPDFTLVTGDFSMRARRREMRDAAEWYLKLPTPRMAIPGNHDVPLLNHLYDRFFNSFGRYKAYIEPQLEPAELLPVGKIIGLNSSTPFGLHIDWSRGFLTPAQGRRIETAFDGVDENLFRFVAFHHPLHRKGESTRILIHPLTLIQHALATGQVDIVFAGHFHQSYAGLIDLHYKQRNVIVSQAPTCCSTRLKGEPAGFHLIHLAPEKQSISIEYFSWYQNAFSHTEIKHFRKIGNRWDTVISA
ncbi:3',5'-cyclic AMP phosphodiesterase CpdA [Rubritalea squalenifaciens DSM 18772]|uniref:3',5'-cyclic AMP phosphodiesterase CpdA n=1 Tax=Rubritalea squalenifaciens DSM 18772 TaxID=1123071 RepID=A0A1M6LSP4_9BACT|nr:metallophosphoesterase [Rubritalea squalenifaciens]SHJ74193.1 3',5'-cyclic AMP phosphodiesterase CpdA [Rubritalea squalenifaciens DSM 18772]